MCIKVKYIYYLPCRLHPINNNGPPTAHVDLEHIPELNSHCLEGEVGVLPQQRQVAQHWEPLVRRLCWALLGLLDCPYCQKGGS